MPKPKNKETRDEFIARFMGNKIMIAKYPDQAQRAAIAFTEWDNRNKKDSIDEVHRFDLGQIVEKHFDKSTGFMTVTGYPTKVGIFTYVKSDGRVVKEFRSEAEVFKQDSLDTLKQKPLTNNHPNTFVNVDNAKELQVGYNGDNVSREDMYVKTQVVINDSATIDAVKKGKRELSCGYSCKVIPQPGEYQGQKYDAIQTDIVYNHIAIVSRGRAGSGACLRLDTEDAMDLSFDAIRWMLREALEETNFGEDTYIREVYKDHIIFEAAGSIFKLAYTMLNDEIILGEQPIEVVQTYIEKKGDTMKKLVLDGKEYLVEDSIADAYIANNATKDALQAKVDTLESEKGILTNEKSILESEKVKLEAKKDALEAEVITKNAALETKKDALDVNAINTLVKERMDVLEVANKVCDKEIVTKFDTLDNLAIKKEIVKAKYPTLAIENKADAYFEAHFEILKEQHADATENIGVNVLNTTGTSNAVEQARIDAAAKNKEQWKQPLALNIK